MGPVIHHEMANFAPFRENSYGGQDVSQCHSPQLGGTNAGNDAAGEHVTMLRGDMGWAGGVYLVDIHALLFQNWASRVLCLKFRSQYKSVV